MPPEQYAYQQSQPHHQSHIPASVPPEQQPRPSFVGEQNMVNPFWKALVWVSALLFMVSLSVGVGIFITDTRVECNDIWDTCEADEDARQEAAWFSFAFAGVFFVVGYIGGLRIKDVEGTTRIYT